MANMKPERMSDFFTTRVDGYDEHMLKDGGEAYHRFSGLVPSDAKKILDLGCGTGLELDEIFQRLPSVSVVGIDLTPAMLNELKRKYPDREVHLICGNYFEVAFGEEVFDAVVSFQTMHHFSHADKERLYARIARALKTGGVYIECDYMVTDQRLEDELYAEAAKVRSEMSLPKGELYHLDTPCTVNNQIAMLMRSGFASAEAVFRVGNTTIVLATKAPD